MLIATLTLAVVVVVVTLVFRWYYLKYKYFDTGIGVKYSGVKMYPLIGQIWMIFGYQPHEYMDVVTKYTFKYGGKMICQIAFEYFIVVTDYKMLEFVLNGSIKTKKAQPYKFFKRWLGSGLLMSNGEKWKQRRKMISPAFHSQILERQLEVFHSAGDILVEEIKKNISIGVESFDVYSIISRCTLDIICEAAMGIKINAQMLKDSRYVDTLREISKIFLDRVISPWNFYDLFYVLSSTYRKEKKALAYLHSHTYSIIRSRRKELTENNNIKMAMDQNVDHNRTNNRYAFLDILLKSTIDDKPLSDEDIREEVDTMTFGGYDTTASAICFALFCIAKYPDVQIKLVQEQKLIFDNDRSRPVTNKDLNGMKYLEMVIKETLRLYPSIPGIAREVTEDCEFDGVKFKKGLQIGLFIYGIHRNPEYFPEPERFLPERFSAENNNGQIKACTFVPFSVGPRNCIGQKFAMLEMKSILSKIIRFLELHAVVPEHILKLVPETTMRCINGFPIRFKHRHEDEL